MEGTHISAPCGRGARAAGSDELATPGDYSLALERVRARLATQARLLEVESARVNESLQDLLAQPGPRRLLLLDNAERYRSRVLCDRLLERAAETWGIDPGAAVELAELAEAIAWRLDPETCGRGLIEDLKALAQATLGNCRRLQGDVFGADSAFARADQHLERGSGDPLLAARVFELQAEFLTSTAAHDEAGRRLDRAIVAYHRAGETRELGRAMTGKAKLLLDQGEVRTASWWLRRALRWISAPRDPQQLLMAQHYLSCCDVALGLLQQAGRRLAANAMLYRRYGDAELERGRRFLERAVDAGLAGPTQAAAASELGREPGSSRAREHGPGAVRLR